MASDSESESGFQPCPSNGRKSNKPLMEKRRRARINSCLNQLKMLVFDGIEKNSSRYSKVEKADILETTVKYLHTAQRQQLAAASSTNPGVVSKYQAGYNECAGEVARYLTTVEGINTEMRVRLLNHLANCFQSNNNNNNTPPPQFPAQNTTPPVQNQTPITAPSSLIQSFNTSASLPQISTLSATMITGAFRVLPAELQFVSGSVPAGDVAFLLPTQSLYFENSNQEGRALYPLPLSIGTQDGSVTAPATGPESKRKDPSPAKQCNPTIENVAIVKDNNNVNKKVVHDNQSLAPIHDALGLHRDNNNMNVLSNNSEMWRPW